MGSLHRLLRIGACAGIAILAIGASLPSTMVGPGEWEVSKTVNGSDGEKVCLSDPALLTQWEHRSKQCERVILSSSPEHAEVHYTCNGGGFGTSRVDVLTPRSIKVDSQGISGGYPFAFVLHAHRIGPCEPR